MFNLHLPSFVRDRHNDPDWADWLWARGKGEFSAFTECAFDKWIAKICELKKKGLLFG